MRKDLEKLFEKFNQVEIEAPEGLFGRIMTRIEVAARRGARIRLAFLGIAGLFSGAGFVYSFQYAAREFSQSGFYQYISLIFSDGGTMLAYWKEFTILMAESLPFFGITILLASVFVLFGLSRLIVRIIKSYSLTSLMTLTS